MNVSEVASLGGLFIAVIVAAISAWSVISAARRQADAALDAARHQTQVNADLALFQIRTTLGAASKQQWVEMLRTELAELCSELLMAQSLLRGKVRIDQVEMTERMRRMTHLSARIALLLDADQASHRELLSALEGPWQSFSSSDRAQFGPAVNALMLSGQQVLKEENDKLRLVTDFTERGGVQASGYSMTQRKDHV